MSLTFKDVVDKTALQNLSLPPVSSSDEAGSSASVDSSDEAGSSEGPVAPMSITSDVKVEPIKTVGKVEIDGDFTPRDYNELVESDVYKILCNVRGMEKKPCPYCKKDVLKSLWDKHQVVYHLLEKYLITPPETTPRLRYCIKNFNNKFVEVKFVSTKTYLELMNDILANHGSCVESQPEPKYFGRKWSDEKSDHDWWWKGETEKSIKI